MRTNRTMQALQFPFREGTGSRNVSGPQEQDDDGRPEGTGQGYREGNRDAELVALRNEISPGGRMGPGGFSFATARPIPLARARSPSPRRGPERSSKTSSPGAAARH